MNQRPRTLLVAVAVLIAAALALVATGVVAWRAGLQELAADGRDDLTLYNAFLQSELNQLDLLASVACGSPTITDLLTHPHDARRRSIANHSLEQFTEASPVAIAYVIDRNGNVLGASNARSPDSLIGQSMRARPYFRTALHGVPARFVGFSPVSGEFGVASSCPVTVQDRLMGAVVVRENTNELVRNWPGLPTTGVIVSERSGIVVLSQNRQWLLHTVRPLTSAQRKALSDSGQFPDQALPLLALHEEISPPGLRIVSLPHDSRRTSYLILSEHVAGWDWTVSVLCGMQKARRWAWQAVVSAAALESVLIVLGLYFYKRRQYVRRLFEASIRDPLTGLYTRLYMSDAVPALEALQDRTPHISLALVMFDIDHFKRVNDTHGHRCGDAVLRRIGEIVLDESRESDIPVRWGGEELAIFLSVQRADEAAQFAQRVADRVRSTRQYEKWHVRVTLSAGVALRHPFESLAHLLERADARLYEAKRAGRDRVVTDDEG